jgi:hypothetical protein
MKDAISLSEHTSFIGEWWLPGHEANRVVGKLTYDPENGIELELESFFEENKFQAIHGYAAGKKISLIDCFSTTLVTPLRKFAQYAPTKIIANKAIFNQHIESEQHLTVDSICFETKDIKTWSYLSGVDSKNFYDQFSEDKKSFNLAYVLPDSKVIYKDQDVEITLNAAINLPPLIPPPTEIVFKERNYFKISNKSRNKGLFFFDYIDAIRKFLSLTVRDDINVSNVMIHSAGTDLENYILYSEIPIELDYKPRNPSLHDMFFSLPSVEGRICELFRKWLAGYKSMTEVYNLYFYKSRGMLHNVFLSKAQALEEFHRSTRPGSGKWGFKSRIENLFERFSDVMKFTGEKQIFSQLVLDHRDYYSHWFQKKESKVFKDVRLDYLSRDANLLLEMCLISQMGFDDSEIVKMVTNNRFYHHYLCIDRPEGNNVFPPSRIVWKNDVLP